MFKRVEIPILGIVENMATFVCPHCGETSHIFGHGGARAEATRLNVPQDQLRVDRVASQEWTDASLGCPQPGQYYAQVITPGYLVTIAGAGKLLEYHADTNRAIFCRQA
jgi:Mrp family chromosome partitioning ATPase